MSVDDPARLPPDEGTARRTPLCLSDAELGQLISSPGPEADRLLDHAAVCDWCGPRLKLLTEMVTSDLTAGEEELLSSLTSNSPEWQQRVGGRVAVTSLRPTPLARRWWVIAAAALVCIASGVVGWRYYNDAARKSDRLLAQAYTARRVFDWRLPDAGWKQREVQRGGTRDRPTAPS